MPKFSFTSPTGQKFEVTTPDGFTEQTARDLFEKQFKSGSLAGLIKGDVLDAIGQFKNGLKSAVAQLDPADLVSKFPSLAKIPINDPINAVKYIQQGISDLKIGPLNSLDVQGLVAQSAQLTKQSSAIISAAKGIGKFGLTPLQLEQQGFLKPGIAKAIANAKIPEVTTADITEALKLKIPVDQFLQNKTLNSFLTSAAWTGKDGIASAATFLQNEKIQSITQSKVFEQGYKVLQKTGAVQALQNSQLGSALMTASKFSPEAAAGFVTGKLGDFENVVKLELDNISTIITGKITDFTGQINGAFSTALNITSIADVAKLGSFALSFASTLGSLFGSGGLLSKGIKIAQAYDRTVNRITVNQAVNSVIGNAKIPIPNFGAALAGIAAAPGAPGAPGAPSFSSQITPLVLENSNITSTLAKLMLETLNDTTRAQQIQTANSVISRSTALISQATALKNQIQAAKGSPNDISLLERIIDGQKTNINTANGRKRQAEDGLNVS
jgi:hypothetical protein